jgi:hypothetical protein
LQQYAVGKFSSLSGSLNGVCVTPIQPYNEPSCPFVTDSPLALSGQAARTGATYDFTTLRGCVVFSNCSAGLSNFGAGKGSTFPSNCQPRVQSKSECSLELPNSHWLPLPIQVVFLTISFFLALFFSLLNKNFSDSA